MQVAVVALSLAQNKGDRALVQLLVRVLAKVSIRVWECLRQNWRRFIGPSTLSAESLQGLSFSAGLAVLLGVMDNPPPELAEPAAKWIGECSSSLHLAALRSLDVFFAKLPTGEGVAHLMPVLTRLLLRSPSLALAIMTSLVQCLRMDALLSGDAFWAQLTSENDENRERATRVVLGLAHQDPLQFLEKLEANFAGKTVKAKKTLLFLCYNLLMSQHLALVAIKDEPVRILRSLLTKETNEEVIYYLVSSLSLLDAVDVEEALKQSKAAIRTSYLAGLFPRLTSPDTARARLVPLLTKGDTSPIDQLVISCLIATSLDPSPQGNLAIPPAWLKTALTPNGAFGDRCISEATAKYPLLNLACLVSIFHDLRLDNVEAKAAWKLLLTLYCGQGSTKRSMNKHLVRVSISLSSSSLNSCLQEQYLVDDAPVRSIGQFLCRVIRCADALLPLVATLNTGPFLAKNVWNSLKRRVAGHCTMASDALLVDTLLACTTVAQVSAIVGKFPETVPTFAHHLAGQIQNVLQTNPSAEELCILNTPDEQLPIVDVITPLRKNQEAAAKKDPTKARPSTSKAEKAAYDAEVAREQAIKAHLLRLSSTLSRCTMIVKAIAMTVPELLERHLGDLVEAGLWTVSQKTWIAHAISPLLHQAAQCCASPLGRFGPLLVTCWYHLPAFPEETRARLLDKDWTITDPSWALSALTRHLPAQATTKNTFALVLPVVLEVLCQCSALELDELHVETLLQHLAANSIHGLSTANLVTALCSFRALVQYLPSTASTIPSLLETMIATAQLDPLPMDTIVELLSGDSEFVRHLGLQLVEILQKARLPNLLRDHPVIARWVAILAHESGGNSLIARRLAPPPADSPSWKDILKVAIEQELAPEICTSAAKLLASLPLVDDHDYCWEAILAALRGEYQRLYRERLPAIGHVRTSNLDLTLVARQRLAAVYGAIAKRLEEKREPSGIRAVPLVIDFFLHEAFFDVNDAVHAALLDAAGLLLRASREEGRVVDEVSGLCDAFLAQPAGGEADRVRVYAVILLAQVAERFPTNDPRRGRLLSSLASTLATPSESVQNAAADAMVPLFATHPADAGEMIAGEYLERFLRDLLHGKSLAIRRGAAFGLGAFVKGLGSHTLKTHHILPRLTTILQDKSSPVESKQGALFGLELMARYLGRSFEPYIVRLLEVLMGTFAEGRTEIRTATVEAAQTMMASVSTLGARLVLPVLLDLLNSTAWRSKVGAIEWLGAMAALAPRVLAKQLPILLPRLVAALADSHHGVQRAAREALTRFGCVVRNPEIRALSAPILEALSNPPQGTAKCLQALLHTAFAHVIDGPSLALLDPILERALRDRATGGTEVKKRAAQIIGNLATNLVDPLDLVDHLPGLVPALLHCLSDPVPEVRAHCGKVLGILVAAVGERPAVMATLVPQLLGLVFGGEASSVDRAGAAQALAEILAARGPVKASELLEETILERFNDQRAFVREGAVLLVGYLAPAFDAHNTLAELYSGTLRSLITATLTLLADENEAVREAASEAAHSAIARCTRIDHVAIFDILLSTLSTAKWRCRLGCLKLFQEYLGKFSSASAEAEGEGEGEDVGTGTGNLPTMPTTDELIQGGIDERRIRSLMSKAFLYRFDGHSSAIRHHALSIWKALASHPLRALIQILPDLLEDCCVHVQRDDEEGRQVVHRAIEDMMGKLGDRLLPTLLDQAARLIAEQPDSAERHLFVLAVTARLLGAGSFPGITTPLLDLCIPKFIALLQTGLVLADEASRLQAGRLFVHLRVSCETLGVGSLISDLVGPLLDELVTDPVVDPVTLDALLVLLRADESGTVLHFAMHHILEAWTKATIDRVPDHSNQMEHASTLSIVTQRILQTALAACASQTVPLLRAIIQSPLFPVLSREAFDETCIRSLAALEADDDSPHQISLSQFLEALHASNKQRCLAFAIVRNYCAVPGADLVRFYDIWPKRLIASLSPTTTTEEDEDGCREEARKTLMALLSTVVSGSTSSYHLAAALEDALKTDVIFDVNSREVIALVVRNVLVPLLTQSTLLAAEGEERRDLASRLIVRLASSAVPSSLTWSTSLTTLVGALIRTAGDRNTTSARIFSALTACVVAQTTLLKPFHPQLQRIFTNALHVETHRESAGAALAALLQAMSRPEALIADLLALASSDATADPALSSAAFEILAKARVVGEPGRVVEVASAGLAHPDPSIRDAASLWVRSILSKDEVLPISQALSSLLHTLH